jgi:hypothetical protein
MVAFDAMRREALRMSRISSDHTRLPLTPFNLSSSHKPSYVSAASRDQTNHLTGFAHSQIVVQKSSSAPLLQESE